MNTRKTFDSFSIADLHFDHTNSWEKFKLPNGDPLRPFSSTEEMNEAIIERWNAVVKPQDHIYVLGDVSINKKGLDCVKRLNGHKRLIMGNHDVHANKKYYEAGFEKLAACRVFVDKWIMTHIPIHPDEVSERFRVNIHGHLHANQVMRPSSRYVRIIDPVTFSPYVVDKETREVVDESFLYEPDPKYVCVSVERTNFTPISFDDLEILIQQRWDAVGYEPPKNAGCVHMVVNY